MFNVQFYESIGVCYT